MKADKSERREQKRRKQKNGMRIGSRSVFNIQEIQRKRAEKIKENKNETKAVQSG